MSSWYVNGTLLAPRLPGTVHPSLSSGNRLLPGAAGLLGSAWQLAIFLGQATPMGLRAHKLHSLSTAGSEPSRACKQEQYRVFKCFKT